jgi:tRNA nucleotidyltransferase (CCA-adding enzyme)
VKTLIATHVNADFDAAAGAYACSRLYPHSDIVIPGSAGRNVREFLALHADMVCLVDEGDILDRQYDRLILIDTSEEDRIGAAVNIARREGVEILVYDHHPLTERSVRAGRMRLEQVGAITTVLIEELLARAIVLSEAEATFLALGIHEDTGSLTFSSATARDAKALAALYEAGAKPEVISRFLHSPLVREQLDLLLDMVRSAKRYRFGTISLTFSGVRASGFIEGASTVAHRLMDLENCDVLVCAIEADNRTHVILRSRSQDVDCLEIGKALGVGGHPQAATGIVRDWSLEAIERLVVSMLEGRKKPSPTAQDIMARPVRIVRPHDSIETAYAMMRRYGHSGFPVVESGQVVGIITRKEIDRALAHRLGHAPVKGFMARSVVTVTPDKSLEDIARLFCERRIGRVPVVENGNLVGIVTRTDLLRALYGQRYIEADVIPREAELTRRLEEFVGENLMGIIRLAGYIADELGYRAFLVGGIIRDLILNERNPDIDIVILGHAIPVAERLVNAVGGRIDSHERFGTAAVILPDGSRIDFASARKEFYARPGALPEVELSSLEEDLKRRDFSINALALSLSRRDFGNIIDAVGGLRDIERKQVRVLHSLSFIEDPTRLVRAVRFAVRFGFEIESTTVALANEAIAMGVISRALGVRMRDEIIDILNEESVVEAIRMLDSLGILASFDERMRFGPVRERQVRAYLRLEERARTFGISYDRALGLLSILMLGVPAERAERLLSELKFRREQMEFVMRVREMRRSIKKIARLPADDLYFALERFKDEEIFVVYAIMQRDRTTREALDRYFEELRSVTIRATGADLQALGVPPSPLMGEIKKRLLRARLRGEISTDEEEYALAKRLAAEALSNAAWSTRMPRSAR